MASIQSVVDLLTKYINLLHNKNVHTEGDQTIAGTKTFTEKLFLAPKEADSQTYIYGTENTAKLTIQNRTVEAITDSLARGSITLQGDDSGQGKFTLSAMSKYDTTNQRYYQSSLVGTSDGSLTWTIGYRSSSGKYSYSGEIDLVRSLSLSSSTGYIRYDNGLQICYGLVTCVNYGYGNKCTEFTYPVSFKDINYQVTVCPRASAIDVVSNIDKKERTYCSVGVRNLRQSSDKWSVDVSIHAIGYWR